MEYAQVREFLDVKNVHKMCQTDTGQVINLNLGRSCWPTGITFVKLEV